jgi:hypothetical protein
MKKDKTILEYCSVCDEELEMPIVQKDAANPHLVWVRCPKCNETKPVDIMASAEDIHEETAAEPEVEGEDEVEAYYDEEEIEGDLSAELPKETIPFPVPDKAAAKKKPAKSKSSKKDKKEAIPELDYKVQKEKAREYHPYESYKPGETIFHKQWKQYGVILRARRSGGGRDMIEARFDKNTIKKLLINQKPAGA